MGPPLSRRRVALPTTSRLSALLNSLITVSSLASVPTTHAINFTSVSPPSIDLSQLGDIGIAGDFVGLSLYEYVGQNENFFSTNGSEALLARLPNGVLTSLVEADASIESMCEFIVDGTSQGVVLAGNFTSLSNQESTGIALFNPNTTAVTPLPGLRGSVNALLCDNDTVYVGGNFMGVDNSTNAVSYTTDGFQALPFAGFNGPVSSITKAANGHVIFGGRFTGLGNTSAPSTPDEQVINLSSANISATNSNTGSGFGDPDNIVCQTSGQDGSGTTWLLADDTAGTWEADMSFGFRPTKLRLYNTHQDGRGTKTWRFTAKPINGIMNFTYIDPSSKQNLTCTSECPLTSNTSVTYQDFHFVNVIGMNGFRIDVSDWYGSGGGLNGVELFQDDIFAYAVNEFNEPSCANVSTTSKSTATGPWSVSPSHGSNAGYLTASLSSPITNDSASVIFYPDIRESGYYTVNVYTPGCVGDDTCDTRGQVVLTATMSSTKSNGTVTTSLFQTNNFDKYDPIYYGYVDATSGSFRPSVTLSPLSGQSLSQQTVVAQKVGFNIYNTTDGLNGLFEYTPGVTTYTSSDFESSAFDSLGMNFTDGNAVNALVTSGDVVYIGGNFTSSPSTNVVAINSQSSTVQSLGNGLNGLVNCLFVSDNDLWAAGAFDRTQDGSVTSLGNVAMYDISAQTWSALGAGVDGPISSLVALTMNISSTTPEVVISLTGNFSNINAFGNNSAVSTDGFAVWVPSQSNWLVNLDFAVEYLNGRLATSVLNVTGSEALYAGSMVSAQLSAVGAARLGEQGSDDDLMLGGLRSGAQSGSATPTTVSGVVAGAFLDSDSLNITVLAGHFSANASNGTTINNIAFIDGSDNTLSGFAPDSGVSTDSTFVAAALQGTTVFVGGNVSGTVNGAAVRGLVAYDLKNNDFGTQPPPVAGDNGSVTVIAVRPDTGDVYVGGSFTSAGSLGCPGVCLYSTSSSQWNRPGNNLDGEARSMAWVTNKRLVAGGNFTVNSSTTTFLVSYTADATAWDSFSGASQIPGPVDVVTQGSSDGTAIWVSGTASNGSLFLMKYDGSNWNSPGQIFGPGTVIRSLQVLSLHDNHDSNDFLDDKISLLLTGRIDIAGFGTASAAIFDGTDLTPFIVTANSNNKSGTISRIFTQKSNFFSAEGTGGLPIYAIVLIGLAIALGLTLLIVVAGMAMERLRKKREGYVPAPTSTYDRGSGMQRIPPQELLESLSKGRPGAPHV